MRFSIKSLGTAGGALCGGGSGSHPGLKMPVYTGTFFTLKILLVFRFKLFQRGFTDRLEFIALVPGWWCVRLRHCRGQPKCEF